MFRLTKPQNGDHIHKAAKADYVIQRGIQIGTKNKIEACTIVCLIGKHTAERIDMFANTIFNFMSVYIYTSTSKQKFPFVSEAKEGYLSTPPMLY